MASFTVPPEVAYRIARAASDRTTLAMLACTSRSLQDASERLLYEFIEVFPHPCIFYLLETLAECPRVAAYVRQYLLTTNPPYRVAPAHERELQRVIQAIVARPDFWERVSASLVHLTELDLLIIMDPTLAQSWILDSAGSLRALEAQLAMAWDEHIADFLKTQDRLRCLTVTEVAENVPIMVLPPDSLPCLTQFEGPLMIVDLLLHCPLTHLRFPVDTEDAVSLLPLVLAELNHLKKLRSLSITMLPPDMLLSSMSAIANSCPNLQYLSYLPLPMDHKSHITLLGYLAQLRHLKALELDIQHWTPPLLPAFQRAVAASLHVVLPKLRYVFFWGRYDRTLWTWAPEEVDPIQVRTQPAFPGDSQEGEAGSERMGGENTGAGGTAAASALEETTSYVGIEGWKHTWGTAQGYSNSTVWKTVV